MTSRKDRFDVIGRIAEKTVPQTRTHAASAKAQNRTAAKTAKQSSISGAANGNSADKAAASDLGFLTTAFPTLRRTALQGMDWDIPHPVSFLPI